MFSIINIFIIPEGLDKLVGHQLHLVVLEGLRKLSGVPNLVSREKIFHISVIIRNINSEIFRTVTM